jgi:hypothetical protein
MTTSSAVAVEKTKEVAAVEEAELEGMPPEFYDEVCAHLCSRS